MIFQIDKALSKYQENCSPVCVNVTRTCRESAVIQNILVGSEVVRRTAVRELESQHALSHQSTQFRKLVCLVRLGSRG